MEVERLGVPRTVLVERRGLLPLWFYRDLSLFLLYLWFEDVDLLQQARDLFVHLNSLLLSKRKMSKNFDL